MRKIGGYVDYIDFDKGIVLRKVEKRAFNGKENWRLDTTISKNGFMYQEYIDKYLSANTNSKLLLSNRVKALSWNSLWQNYYRETGSSNLIIGACVVYSADDGTGKPLRYIRLTPYSTLPTVAEWKAQLTTWYEEGNPFTVWYAIATKEEAIELPKLPQFKGTTIYEIDTQIAATISGKYKRTEE